MVRRRYLLSRAIAVFTIAAVLSLLAASPARAASGCTSLELQTTGCPTIDAGIRDGGVTIGGVVTSPGSPGTGNRNGTGQTPGGTNCPTIGNRCIGDRNGTAIPAVPAASAGPFRDGYTVTAPVTLRDLVNFRPVPGVDHMEPNGWIVIGLDTNFYAVVGVQVQDGQLLGQPASVRFTPVRYHWTYGDGSAASHASGGDTWAARGITEFDPTSTSHVYRVAGTYNIDLVIDFAAEYRYAGGAWTPIFGVIPVPANRLEATAGAAKTVLVERDCTASPPGPGC